MKSCFIQFWFLLESVLTCLFISLPTVAQIVPDNTLPTNSSVLPNCTTCEITGGTSVGNTLFHSFREFSVPTGGSAYFNNASTINHIISRITGRSVSNIDGLIRANSSTNLFLLNPNGIIFGPNASLDIGGSFLATTADSINFPDNGQFSATNPQSNPLLIVGVPIGLQFGQSPGAIRNEASTAGGLQSSIGRTVALVGGEVVLPGGILATENGRIEIGGVANSSLVRLIPVPNGWTLGYEDVSNFQDIRLLQNAIVSTSGLGSSIQFQGRNVTITGGSLVFSDAAGREGNLAITATDSVNLRGDGTVLTTFTRGAEDVGNLAITTRNLRVAGGAVIQNSTFGEGRGGRLLVRATEAVEVSGTNSAGDRPSAIASVVGSTGRGGTILIEIGETGHLTLQDGGAIDTSTFGAGNAGRISIKAPLIELEGTGPILGPNPQDNVPSGIFAQVADTATQGAGDAGSLIIRTEQLRVLGGAQISTAGRFGGNGGTIRIHASDIQLSGEAPGATRDVGRSGIFVSVESGATLNAGELILNTRRLTVENGAEISANNRASGASGGNATLTVGQLILQNGGEIRATTRAGIGGNIKVQDLDLLLMSNQSQISARAFNNALGGNITIDAASGFVVAGASQNNDIVANAFEGRGGNIDITAQGIIGLEERRSQPTNTTNDIDASSEFGAPGTVTITRAEVDPSRGLAELPTVPITAEPTQGCQVAGGQAAVEFYNTGRGGVAPTPYEPFSSSEILDDVRLPGERAATPSTATNSLTTPEELPDAIVEAQGWKVDETGRVVLLAALPEERSHVFCHLR